MLNLIFIVNRVEKGRLLSKWIVHNMNYSGRKPLSQTLSSYISLYLKKTDRAIRVKKGTYVQNYCSVKIKKVFIRVDQKIGLEAAIISRPRNRALVKSLDASKI